MKLIYLQFIAKEKRVQETSGLFLMLQDNTRSDIPNIQLFGEKVLSDCEVINSCTKYMVSFNGSHYSLFLI